jgi:hypothetical protein
MNYADLTDSLHREIIASYGPSDLTLWRYTWIAMDPKRLDPELRPTYDVPPLAFEDAHAFVDALRAGTSGAILVTETFGNENVEVMEVNPHEKPPDGRNEPPDDRSRKAGDPPPPEFWPPVAKYNYPIRKVDGVYPPDLFAARVLDATLPNIQAGQTGLVLCTGAGLEAVTLAKEKGVSVDAVDINDAAVLSTNQAARDNGVESLVHAWKSDGLDQVEGKYDFIIYSGPLPRSTNDIRGTADANYHDIGGDLLKRTLNNLSNHLNPGGVFYLITDEELIFSVPAGTSKEVVDDTIVWNMPMTIYAIRKK